MTKIFLDEREQEKGRKKRRKRNSWSQIKIEEDLVIAFLFVRLCVSVFLFATYPYVDGPFCRFVGHVRNVNYQNATRNDRQMELVGTCWYPACERKNTARARERRIRQRWIDEWKLRK